MLFWIIKILIFIPSWLIFPTVVKKQAKLPKGKLIVVSNHLSNLDAFLILLTVNIRPYVFVKKEAFKNKFSKFFLTKILRCIEVDRNNFALSTLKFSNKVLKNDNKLLIFPEGTRNKTGEKLCKLKSGTALIAIKNQSNIVPIWITKKPKCFRLTKILIGESFNLQKFYDIKLSQEILEDADKVIYDKLLCLSNWS